ncbi:hypothetical protein AMJ48_02490 [Parcubacteria bacterium DG_74_1]|nr:MAG: hypothetical protein AMJ48_02490 [Parcubacteria bacterium DG_74_1]
MRFEIEGPFKENIYILMRKINYYFFKKDEQKGELEFARPAKGYPRFHLFVKTKDDSLILNLHLDQKKPTYEGVPAHAGEYDSETVQKEAGRIKEILK